MRLIVNPPLAGSPTSLVTKLALDHFHPRSTAVDGVVANPPPQPTGPVRRAETLARHVTARPVGKTQTTLALGMTETPGLEMNAGPTRKEFSDSIVRVSIPDKVTAITLAFKQQKIALPLKLTLMVKNLNGLWHLAGLAGFGSVEEALLTTEIF